MGGTLVLTDLLRRAEEGDKAALGLVFDATYEELRRIARIRLSKGGRGTLLDTTSLVNESYLRLANAGQLHIGDREHFLRYAGHAMRSVIVDYVRKRMAERRGGDAVHVPLDSQIGGDADAGESEILRVHEALGDLARFNARMVQVVELRYFAGLTELEVADVLGVTERTVRRDWEKARLLLAEALR